MALNAYMQMTQRLLRDQGGTRVNPGDITKYVNLARRETAMRAQCVRFLTPISGSIASGTVTAAGAGYTNPTVTISAPDFPPGVLPYPNGLQATASVTHPGGALGTVSILIAGAGYFNPTAVVTDSGPGAGGTIALTTSGVNQLAAGQEVYPFSNIILPTGMKSIVSVRSASIIYANYRYSLPCYSFSVYQAMIRQYPFQYQYVPTFCSQYGRGSSGSMYFYPLPSTNYQFELDCFGIPADLAADSDTDLIPDPWNDAVPYHAAYLAYLDLQDANAARGMKAEFDEYVHRYGSYASPGRITNPYGRW